MLYNSLSGDVRQNHMEDFHASYYSSFTSVMAAAKRTPMFTLEEYKKEFISKNMFGLMMGCLITPMILIDAEDAPSIADMDGADMEKMVAEMEAKMAEMIQKSPLLKPRFYSLLDEMRTNGLY